MKIVAALAVSATECVVLLSEHTVPYANTIIGATVPSQSVKYSSAIMLSKSSIALANLTLSDSHDTHTTCNDTCIDNNYLDRTQYEEAVHCHMAL